MSKQKSQEENETLKKRIEETEYELELIRKKGISIKVIDNNITKIQKRRKNDNKAKIGNHHRKERALKKTGI